MIDEKITYVPSRYPSPSPFTRQQYLCVVDFLHSLPLLPNSSPVNLHILLVARSIIVLTKYCASMVALNELNGVD